MSTFLFVALVWLPLYVPLIAGILLYVPGDTLGFSYPALAAVSPFSIDSLLVDPLSGRGFPWLITYGTLDPLAHIVRIFMGPYTGLALLCYLYMVLSTWTFLLFLKRIGVSMGAALIGGFAYAGVFFWVADGDFPFPLTLFLYAALLYAGTFVRSFPVRSTAAIAALVAYGWLGGHFNYIPLIALSLLVYSGVQSVVLFRRADATWAKPFAAHFIGIALGSVIGLLKVLPALAYAEFSERAGGLSLAAASGYTLPVSVLYSVFFPYMTLPYIAGETGLLFSGTLGIFLLLYGLFSPRKQTKLAIIGFLLCIVLALPHSPLYAVLYKLPFFSFLRTPRRWLFIGNACAAVIVACTADRITQKRGPGFSRLATFFWWFGLCMVCIAVISFVVNALYGQEIVAFFQQYFDAHFYAQTSGLPREHYHRHITNLWALVLGNVSLLSARFLFPLAGLLLVGWLFRSAYRSITYSTGILLLVALLTQMPSLFFLHPKTSLSHLEEASAVWKDSDVGQERIMPVFSGLADQLLRTGVHGDVPKERLQYQVGLLVPNTHALVGLSSVDFYQPLQPTRQSRILALLGSTSAPAPAEERLALSAQTLEEKIDVFASRVALLQRLGVQYVSSAFDLPAPFTLERSLTFAENLPPIHLYFVPSPLPTISVAENVLLQEPNEDAAISFLRTSTGSSTTLIECTDCEPATAPVSVQIDVEKDTYMHFTVNASNNTYIVVRKPRLLGWRVSVDGQAIKTAFADAQFFAIPVPAGEHMVELEIRYSWLLEDSIKLLLNKEDPWLL